MGSATKLLFLVLVFVASDYQTCVKCESQVPCYFIFGDSYAENGNNNQLKTRAKANYEPYGVDFPDGPTGRYSNGINEVDVITEKLGFTQSIPPFATASGKSILQGVNYASGSAGIRDETGTNFGENINLNKQLQNHQKTVANLTKIVGSDSAATDLLSKCLYTVEIGSNDYINNYYRSEYFPTSSQYTLDQYAGVLVDQFSQQLTSLHNTGARKVALFGLAPIGCFPYSIVTYGKNGSCSDEMNKAVLLFNGKLKSLVDDLNGRLAGAKFIYLNTYEIWPKNSSSLGFKVVDKACCPNSGLCDPGKTPCPNRNEYMFFDGVHPTEPLIKYTAERSFEASDPSFAHPYDISRLIQQQ